MRYARSHHIFKNEYILSLEPLISEFKLSLGITRLGRKGTSIYLYSLDYQLLKTFSSSREAGGYFQCNHITIMRYARSGKIFQDQYILSFEKLSKSSV